MNARTWLILTGEYPPAHGGVSEYTFNVARELAQRGDAVHVWTAATTEHAHDGVNVHSVGAAFSASAFSRLDDAINNAPPGTRVLVQYVPHAYGYKAMNVRFARWLGTRRAGTPIDVMFHEVAYPIESNDPWRRRMLGHVNRWMAKLIVRRADRIFVSTPAWEGLLRPMVGAEKSIAWSPVPANVSTITNPNRVAEIRAPLAPNGEMLIGHFGTFGAHIGEMLRATLPRVLERSDQRVVLIGRGAEAFGRSPGSSSRIVCVGDVSADDVANHLAACDVLLQPYPDGANARRSSMMAGLSIGAAIVSNRGHNCDIDRWLDPNCIALASDTSAAAISAELERVLSDDVRRDELRRRAAVQYDAQFALRHTIDALRDAAE